MTLNELEQDLKMSTLQAKRVLLNINKATATARAASMSPASMRNDEGFGENGQMLGVPRMRNHYQVDQGTIMCGMLMLLLVLATCSLQLVPYNLFRHIQGSYASI
jgi:hypothetical protein